MSHLTHRATLRFAPILLASLVLSIGQTTVAQGGDTPVTGAGTSSTRITLADLNLATPQGQAEARRRLAATAKRLCREVINSRRVEANEAMADCLRDALAPGLVQVIELAGSAAGTPVTLSSTTDR